jgi:hypothetical protein
MRISGALTKTYEKLLRAHYRGQNHTLTTMELARAMGWDTHGPVNLHYGTFAAKLAERMRWVKEPSRPEVDAIVSFGGGGPDDPDTLWIMHPQLARALEDASIVARKRDVV